MHSEDNTHGRIGIPLEGVKVKLIDWTEGGYSVNDKPNPRGEIMICGDCVVTGYYELPDENKESFICDSNGERWFMTGDIAEVLHDGSFKIIDRKKDLTKLANGEFISLGKVLIIVLIINITVNSQFIFRSKLHSSRVDMWTTFAFVRHRTLTNC